VSRYQKAKTNLDFSEARDSEWQWHQLGHKQVCTSLQTDNHASTPPLSFLQAGCRSCRPTNSVKALKAKSTEGTVIRHPAAKSFREHTGTSGGTDLHFRSPQDIQQLMLQDHKFGACASHGVPDLCPSFQWYQWLK